MRRTWRIAGTENKDIDSLDDVRRLLFATRNISEAQQPSFLDPTYEGTVDNPFGITNMAAAVERLLSAAKHQEDVLIWGDYDADGVSGTAVLVEGLQAVGIRVTPYLPHRADEGYGLNLESLKEMIDTFDILLTVDCGISNPEEVAWVQAKGKDVIIVDHHEVPATLPPAFAILHPRHSDGVYTTPHLSGAGMGWKLAQALLRRTNADDAAEKRLLDLPLLGTLADSMPLVLENRAIVRFGMEILRRTKRPGLLALMKAARVNVETMTPRDVAFRIIPAINAAGRMDHPQAALDALLARTTAEGEAAAARLIELNQARREVTARVTQEAMEYHDPNLPVVFAFNAAWPPGIVGIVASKLAERFRKPAVVMGAGKHAAVGSARTFGGIDVYAAMENGRKHTVKLGGHKQAAGVSLMPENMEKFKSAIVEAMGGATEIATEDVVEHRADAVVSDSLLSWDLQRLTSAFEPFGEGMPEPTFVVRGLVASGVRPVGKTGTHVKMRLLGPNKEIESIGFGLAERNIADGQEVDALGTVQLNTFRGNASLQFQLLDVGPTGSVTISS